MKMWLSITSEELGYVLRLLYFKIYLVTGRKPTLSKYGRNQRMIYCRDSPKSVRLVMKDTTLEVWLDTYSENDSTRHTVTTFDIRNPSFGVDDVVDIVHSGIGSHVEANG